MKNSIFFLVIIFMLSIYQVSYSQSGLSKEDIEYIKELKEKHLWPDKLMVKDVTPEKLKEIKKIVNQMEREYKFSQEMDEKKPLTTNELSQLDTLLRSKWNAMRDSLYNGKIERALIYFSSSSKNNYRNIFKALSKNECKQLSQDLRQIKFIGEMGNFAEYDLRRSVNGKKLSFQVIFEKDIDGEWYIKSF